MKILALIVSILLLFLSCSPKKKSEISVLFVGNSLTYYNDVPSKVAALYLSITGKKIKVDMIAEGGLSLEQHLKKSFVVKKIKNNHYYAVVLQDFGGWPLCSTQIPACSRNSQSLEKLILLSEESKAKPIWYSTYQTSENFQRQLSKKVEELSNKFKVDVADIGHYLMKYKQLDSKNNPFSTDWHLNQRGSWIATAGIVRELIDKDIPLNLNIPVVCSHDWRGYELKATQLAALQSSKQLPCIRLDTAFANTIASLINNN
jgi:hypothetical protein